MILAQTRNYKFTWLDKNLLQGTNITNMLWILIMQYKKLPECPFDVVDRLRNL